MTGYPLKCLILDDEELLRELLKRSIDWQKFELELVAEASSAMEAVELVESCNPDLIFVDICMPVMNGIEFSSLILGRFPHIKVIVLTGHDEFDYARQSIKIGVSDFLLKPINPEEIDKTLYKVCTRIRKEKKNLRERTLLRKHLEESFPLLKERFLHELVSGSADYDKIQNRLEYFDLSFSSNWFQVSILEIHLKGEKRTEEAVLMCQLQCLEYIKLYFCREKDLHQFPMKSNRIVLINTVASSFETDFYETVRENLASSFQCGITIGVGQGKEGMEAIAQSFDEAEQALRSKITEGRNSVFYYGEISGTGQCAEKDLQINLQDLSFYIKGGVKDKAVDIIHGILKNRCSGTEAFMVDLRIPALNILSHILNSVRELDFNDFFSDQYIRGLYKTVLSLETLPEIGSFLGDIVGEISDRIISENSRKTGKLISEVKEYLRDNYNQFLLTQNSVSEKFHVNSCYLSRKFKEETGRSFVEFLSRIRLDHALQLMQDTDMRNYEISEKVGIADPHYFSIFFKKYMNMSISEYRKSIGGD